MYTPKAYVESDLFELDRLVTASPFATLITVLDGAPSITHLPVLYARHGTQVVFRGHWSRANRQWRQAGDALLIVHGPDTYISPSWYSDKEEQARVPTWNYAVAHIAGTLEIFHDTDALAAIVSELSDRHEAAIGSDWHFDADRADLRVQLKGIVGFRLEARHIELKLKLNQNHPEANRRSVTDALTALGGERAEAIADLMRARLARATLPDDPAPAPEPTEP